MLGIVLALHRRHLVGASKFPRSAHRRSPSDAGPSLRRADDQHRPGRPCRSAAVARGLLDARGSRRTRRRAPPRASPSRSSPGHDQRVPAVALEELRQLRVVHRPVDRRVRDLVAVQVQDRQHRPAGRRVEELVRVPRAGGRAGLGLAVARRCRRRSDPGCRAPRRRRWRARSRARRPRESCPGPSGRGGWESRRARRSCAPARRGPRGRGSSRASRPRAIPRARGSPGSRAPRGPVRSPAARSPRYRG